MRRGGAQPTPDPGSSRVPLGARKEKRRKSSLSAGLDGGGRATVAMVGLNVPVRLLGSDDLEQQRVVLERLEQVERWGGSVLVSSVVLAEPSWVLSSAFGYDPRDLSGWNVSADLRPEVAEAPALRVADRRRTLTAAAYLFHLVQSLARSSAQRSPHLPSVTDRASAAPSRRAARRLTDGHRPGACHACTSERRSDHGEVPGHCAGPPPQWLSATRWNCHYG